MLIFYIKCQKKKMASSTLDSFFSPPYAEMDIWIMFEWYDS